MATSSIFTNVVIDDEDSARRIIKAIENFEAKGSPVEKTCKLPIMSRKEFENSFLKGYHKN